MGKETTDIEKMGGDARSPGRPPLEDDFGRQLTYLRLSITDRCNLRCTYCRPKDFSGPRENILSFEEIMRVVRATVNMGIDKVRVTGGEPLVRKGSVELIGMLASIDGIKDLTLTTNATLLEKYAGELKKAGLKRVNISLDTLRPGRFKDFTGGDIEPVLSGIDAARAEGLTPVKLNTVLMKGFNDDEIADIIKYAAERSMTLRIIEFMPIGGKTVGMDWESHYMPVAELLKDDRIGELVDLSKAPAEGPERPTAAAFYLPLKSGKGDVGFIAPMSKRFCEGCNRLRLTADGKIRSCLPSETEVDLRPALRDHTSDDALIELIKRSVHMKPEFGEYDKDGKSGRSMTRIGG